MSRIAYVNGRFVPQAHATVAMEDRGYQFADGIYEVIALYEGRLLDAEGHLARLERSLKELQIQMPMSMRALECLIGELIRRNRRQNGLIYMQVTRGVALRNHISKPAHPVLSMSLNPAKYPDAAMREKGVAVITAPDERWARCDVKSIALLPNVLARQASAEAGAREAWQINAAGVVTEGSLSNAYIVKDGTIITHPLSHEILGGITREVVLGFARAQGIAIDERAFTPAEAAAADEAFLTSASSFVLPVTQLNAAPIGGGKVGAITQQLMAAYDADIEKHSPNDCHSRARLARLGNPLTRSPGSALPTRG
jgi:D-alanine transaminase